MRGGFASTGAIGAVVLAAALTASPASAQYETVSTAFDVPEAALFEAEVACPGGGDAAISGGTYNGAPINEMLWLNSSRPGSLADPGEVGSWMVRVHNVFDPITTTYPGAEGWAVCAVDGAGDYKVRKTTNLPAKPLKQVKFLQRCKDGEAVVGGGVELNEAATGAYVSTSAPKDDNDRDERPDGWSVVIETQGLDNSGSRMDVYAVCDKVRGPSKYRYASEDGEAADGAPGDATAVCDVLDPRVGGGVKTNAKLKHQLRINTTYPAGSTGWSVTVDNVDTPDNEARKVTATAICLKT